MSNFTRNWSTHIHNHSLCNKTLTFDGLWKIHRAKCSYQKGKLKSNEFGKIVTGCINTPNRNSFFCSAHKDKQLFFNVNEKYIPLNPKSIIPKALGNLLNYLSENINIG